MSSNNVPPYDSKVSKFPPPGLSPARQPGAVYVAPGCEPKDFLFQVMRDQNQHWDRRMEAAKALLPYYRGVKGPIKRK